jgi:phasin family protein
MADTENGKAEASAEKAYAEALDTIVPVKGVPAEPVASAAEPVPPAMVIPSVKPKAARKSAKPVAKANPAAKAKPAAKPVAKPAAKLAAKPAKSAAKKLPAAAPAASVSAMKFTSPAHSAIAKTKDTTMTMKTKITEGFETVIGEAQAKAKEAFEKSTAMLGDYAEFAKGNVEAVVESGKILAEGLQDMGTNLVAEGRSTFETVSSDLKGMAAAKSPTDLIQLQSEMFRKSFDSAMAYGSKNTEAMLKIASDAIAPISSRVSLAVEKVRQAAV